MAQSKKHHYLPQFYLKGFLNENKEFFVFDKKLNQIRKSSPDKSFFENNRNSSQMGNERSVFLEDIYSYFDSLTAPHLDKLRKKTVDNCTLDSESLARMQMFICQLFWRIPGNDLLLSKMADELTFEQAGFDIINKNTRKSIANKELQDKLKSEEIFRKMYSIFLPFISIRDKSASDFHYWRLYFRKDKCQVVGDIPIVLKKLTDFKSLNEEIIFPISCDKILVHTKNKTPTNLPSIFITNLDLLMVQQAKRFVCCSNEAYLTSLINILNESNLDFDPTEHMIASCFNFFK